MSELIDNRRHRVQTLKEIIRHLHEGTAPDEVRAQLRELVVTCDAAEVAQMEQELMDEGISVKEIMGMCDLHSQIVSEVTVDRPMPTLAPGHPLKTFQTENQAVTRQVDLLRSALRELSDGADDREPAAEAVYRCRGLMNELMDIDKHYLRKEHLLFSMLERHGITGPSRVMWGKDDEVRALLEELHQALLREHMTGKDWDEVANTIATAALHAAEEMVFKEERILLPMALQTLTEIEWGEIWKQSPQFGWCLVDPEEGYSPTDADGPGVSNAATDETDQTGYSLNIIPPSNGRTEASADAIMFPTALTLEQLTTVFSMLPVDLTFVDADDRVRFFSEGPRRVFVRPKAVIGRKVQHCHPPGSVHIVDEILRDFRSGTQDVADFWLEHNGRFVFVRYFAVRDPDGAYMGTLEVTQDLTRERGLQGERRLLQYDDA